MLFLIHWKSFEFSTWLTREMFIWLKNSTLGISNSEDFHCLHWRLVADYPGHVTTYFRTQCQRPVHPKDLICDIWHSIKIKYPYTKPLSLTPFNSNSHPSHFCTKLWSKTSNDLGKIDWAQKIILPFPRPDEGIDGQCNEKELTQLSFPLRTITIPPPPRGMPLLLWRCFINQVSVSFNCIP